MKYIQGTPREQAILFPETINKYVDDDNPVRFIDAFVEQLDLQAAGFQRAQPSVTGRPPYAPGDLLKLYIYGYLNRIRSSRILEQEAARNVEIMWLLGYRHLHNMIFSIVTGCRSNHPPRQHRTVCIIKTLSPPDPTSNPARPRVSRGAGSGAAASPCG